MALPLPNAAFAMGPDGTGIDVPALLGAHAPRMENALTLSRLDKGDRSSLSGTCISTAAPVIVSGSNVRDTVSLVCQEGRFAGEARIMRGAGDIVVSQISPDGSMFYARAASGRGPSDTIRTSPVKLAQAIRSAAPGTQILLEPGTYSRLRIFLPKRASGTRDAPIVIDGQEGVRFTDDVRINVAGDYITLRGLTFDRAGANNVQLDGANTRLTGNIFRDCGDRPRGGCVVVRGPNAEIGYNTFIGSRSVSVKVRGTDTGDQPTRSYIHHNQFLHIPRLSDNGQEPIQIAGQDGQITHRHLDARIEHNTFYRTDGDTEAVSLKSSGNSVRWNIFKDTYSSPNIRGGIKNIISYNILVRTLPIRATGSNNSYIENIIVCPKNGYAISLVPQGEGHAPPSESVIKGNIAFAESGFIRYGNGGYKDLYIANRNNIFENMSIGSPIFIIRRGHEDRSFFSNNTVGLNVSTIYKSLTQNHCS